MASVSGNSTGIQSDSSAPQNYSTPLATMMSLMFMIGFITCLNDILLPHLKSIFSLSYFEASMIQVVFFLGYFVFAIPSGKIVSMFGYKKSGVIGLVMSGIGAFLFYPAAAIPSYPFFLLALFTVACGFAMLQVVVNPYVSVLGKPETSSSRLVLVQAFNSVGTTVAPEFGKMLILGTATLSAASIALLSPTELASYKLAQASSVQVPYVGLSIALILLGVIVSFLNLPSIKSVEGEAERNTTYGQVLKKKHLVFGVLGIFAYVGGEVAIGSYLINFIGLPNIAGLAEQEASAFVKYYWGGAMVGRFVGSWLLTKVQPGKLLGVQAAIAALLVVVALVSNGAIAMWALLLVGLMNSIMFATIFTLAIKDLGPLTNKGGSLLNMAIVGGAIIPALQGYFADSIGLHQAFFIPVICYAYIVFYGFVGSNKD